MTVGAGPASESLRHAQHVTPGSGSPDAGLARSMIAVGLSVAAVAFAGRYAFHFWKPLEQVISRAARNISNAPIC